MFINVMWRCNVLQVVLCSYTFYINIKIHMKIKEIEHMNARVIYI